MAESKGILGEQLTIMTTVSHITDLGSLTSKPVLYSHCSACIHASKPNRMYKNAPQRRPWLEYYRGLPYNRSDTAEKDYNTKDRTKYSEHSPEIQRNRKI